VRIGVFGGQFDPPHVGHLIVCQEARYRLALDRLLVVPAGTPAHRAPPETPAELRLRLAEAAFAGEPRTEVSRIELERPGPSYTVDTLEALAGEGELYLILGADQYATFERWREPDRIRRLARLAVAPRPGAPVPDGDAIVLPSPLVDVSSSELRRRLAAGEPVRHVIPAGALALLERGSGAGRTAWYAGATTRRETD
jgi:nicotinate-nucleotide adenylyltransferase